MLALLFIKIFCDDIEDFLTKYEPRNIKMEAFIIEFMKNSIFLSDFHIGKKYEPNDTIPLLVKQIRQIRSAEKAEILFILGDILDGTCQNGAVTYLQLLRELENLEMETYILGGNHDRHFMKANSNFTSSFIHLVMEPLIILANHTYMCHDLHHNIRIRGKHIPLFFKFLKKLIPNMSENDTLIIGHTHEQLSIGSSFSIGQFSIDEAQFYYSVGNSIGILLKEHKYSVANTLIDL